MAVAIVAISTLCACHDEPYRDNPEEVAAKTAMIENAFKTLRQQPWGSNTNLKVQATINPGTPASLSYTYPIDEVRIAGDLIYFGDNLVLHVAQYVSCTYAVDSYHDGHPINKAVLYFLLP